MRLINVKTLELIELFNQVPPYAILSHTWGDEEVTFQEHLAATGPDSKRHAHIKRKAGFHKIMGACERAQSDGLQYLWCDTNCIDKSSSTELSEAINSMYAWYNDSEICYVYLADVSGRVGLDGSEDSISFEQSRWFTRGWTLQELLAPKKVVFFDLTWKVLGDRKDLANRISKITRIHSGALHDRSTVSSYSIAQRMSWAADRVTSRQEDIAYCLLGIFDVNMPLLYGEGKNAFIRLQKEIIKISDDQSILAWDLSTTNEPSVGCLATAPIHFRTCGSIVMERALQRYPYSHTNMGLSMSAPVIETLAQGVALIGLNCVYKLYGQANEGSSNLRRSFQVWLRVRQIGQDLYDRCNLPASRVYLEESYAHACCPKSTQLFLSADLTIAIHLKPKTKLFGSIKVSSMPHHSSGIITTVSCGEINLGSRIFSQTYPLPSFYVVCLRPRGASTISHELVCTEAFSTIISIAWDRNGCALMCLHSSFRDSGMRKARSLPTQQGWAVVFNAEELSSYTDAQIIRAVHMFHDELKASLSTIPSSPSDDRHPTVHVSGQSLINLHGRLKIVVDVVFGERPRRKPLLSR